MTTAPLHQPTIRIANFDVEPTDAWVRAIAVLLLRDLDRERAQLESDEHLEEQGEQQHEISADATDVGRVTRSSFTRSGERNDGEQNTVACTKTPRPERQATTKRG